ncbi:hypothetical protein VTJ04DRAFT_8421 [Mycothermus thermophilus]|jgi:3'(2'), 5'-bisphosphate nucleotidase|uniref:uncharacterized protein n=1 Tax=Humicola insolens TaxID=85995 RepID=UPI00374432CE
MDSPYRRELEVAITAAQTAAHISRKVLLAAGSGDDGDVAAEPFDVVKDDLSPVTVADFAIQAFLVRSLGQAFPEDGFVGEESSSELKSNQGLVARILAVLGQFAGETLFRDAQDLYDTIDLCVSQHTSNRVWVFDPIDGTKTFLRGEQYAINIALLEGGRQVLSVVACPLLSADATGLVTDATVDPTGKGCILYAVRGHGAFVRPLPGRLEEVQARRLPRHADSVTSSADLRAVTCWARLDSGVDVVHKAVAEQLAVSFPGSDLLGWVLRWAVLALGIANMTVWVYKRRDRYAKVWDHAGAMLLFEEVGGKITDIHGKGIDLTVGRTLKANFGFVAAPQSLHQHVLEALHRELKAQGKEELLN